MRGWIAGIGFCTLIACGGADAAAGHTASAPPFENVPAADSGRAAPARSSEDSFSFFVTSFAALQRLSQNEQGFGGDLRYGEADGLSGADKICSEIAESSLPGAGGKPWRAFLSVTKGANGRPVHAIDRIGNGPWYDRLGRLLAATHEDLLNVRPLGGDPAIVDDFPNEDGVPNHAPDGVTQVDNHDVLTGTNDKGQLYNADGKYTCHDWTSSLGSDGTPHVGHSWPRPGKRELSSGDNWMSALNEAGCAAGASLVEMGGPKRDNPAVGSGGGYGAIYCFVLTQ